MVIGTNVPVKFSNIQTEFGGTNPISISEYYKDSTTGYSANASLPLKNTLIKISNFQGKSK